MEGKVVKINSPEELEKFLSSLHKEVKKEEVKGAEVAEANYDKFIDATLDFCVCAVEDGSFTRDVAIFREHLHEAPIGVKRAFYKNFKSVAHEMINDTMELVAEYAFLKKIVSDEKPRDKKVKDYAQTKKEKKNSNL